LSLSWFLFIFINIDNSPSLMNLSVSLFHDDVSILIVLSSINCNYLSSFICNKTILVSEHLPPSRSDAWYSS
jgi:hypothetical protein